MNLSESEVVQMKCGMIRGALDALRDLPSVNLLLPAKNSIAVILASVETLEELSKERK